MSLWCGVCRREIEQGFGLLYRMQVINGDLRLPTRDKEYVPPNSAVCDACWAKVPQASRLLQLPQGPEVYAYAVADSGSHHGVKEWSSIEAARSYVFLSDQDVATHLPKVIEIVERDAKNKQAAEES